MGGTYLKFKILDVDNFVAFIGHYFDMYVLRNLRLQLFFYCVRLSVGVCVFVCVCNVITFLELRERYKSLM